MTGTVLGRILLVVAGCLIEVALLAARKKNPAMPKMSIRFLR
jgi:hypothetical protein